MEIQHVSPLPEHGRRSATTESLGTHVETRSPPPHPPRVPSSADVDAGTGRAPAPSRRPPPGTLDLSIRRRGTVIELGLTGDLDRTTAPRLEEAMAWLRGSFAHTTTIVIDTTDVGFITADGYQALQEAQVGQNGLWDPRVICIVGPAIARAEAAIAHASAPSAGRTG
jgi:anti-anti-sigma regulatory factor